MKKLLWLLLIGALAGLGYWAYRHFLPDEETVIRRKFEEMARLAKFSQQESQLVRIARARQFAAHFDDRVRVRWERVELMDRDEIFQSMLGLRSAVPKVSVRVVDISVHVVPESDQATARLTVVVDSPDDPYHSVQELRADLRKSDDGWLIVEVEPVETLR